MKLFDRPHTNPGPAVLYGQGKGKKKKAAAANYGGGGGVDPSHKP